MVQGIPWWRRLWDLGYQLFGTSSSNMKIIWLKFLLENIKVKLIWKYWQMVFPLEFIHTFYTSTTNIYEMKIFPMWLFLIGLTNSTLCQHEPCSYYAILWWPPPVSTVSSWHQLWLQLCGVPQPQWYLFCSFHDTVSSWPQSLLCNTVVSFTPSIHCHHDPSSDYAILWCPSPTILTVSAWPQWWLCNTMVSFTYNTHCVSMTPVVTMQYCGVKHLQYPLCYNYPSGNYAILWCLAPSEPTVSSWPQW